MGSTRTTVMRWLCMRSVKPVASAADVVRDRIPTLIVMALLSIAGLRA